MDFEIQFSQHNNLNIAREFHYQIFLNNNKIFESLQGFTKIAIGRTQPIEGNNILEIHLINEKQNQTRNGCFDGCHLQVDSIKMGNINIDPYGTWHVEDLEYPKIRIQTKANRSFAGNGKFVYTFDYTPE